MRELVTEWGDGSHTFALRFAQLEELEDKSKGYLVDLKNRWGEDRLKVSEVRDVIRIGLIGGGMPAADAMKLVVKHYDDVPFSENMLLVGRILFVSLYGRDLVDILKEAVENTAGEAPAAGETA